MTLTDLMVLTIGIGSVVFGCVADTFYYTRGLHGKLGEQAPTWLGRLLFIGTGCLAVALEVRHLLLGR
jgi:hypothetical protein